MIDKSNFRKILVVILIIFIAAMSWFGVVMHNMAGQVLKEQMGNKCLGIATSVATLLEKDIVGYKEFVETLDVSSDYYITLKRDMEKIRHINIDNIAFLYVEIRISEYEMMYLFDGEFEDSITFAKPGSTDPLTKSRIIAYETESMHIGDFVTTQWGTLLSAYAPIVDPETQEFLGLVGTDVSIEQYDAVLKYQTNVIVFSVLLMIFLVTFLLVMSSETVEKAIARDSLTGAYSKAYFIKHLRTAIKNAKKRENTVAVFMIDIDHFKKVNDTYGHPFGDIVLKQLSESISEVLRDTDCFSRYGGEEFSICLTGVETRNVTVIAERIRLMVANDSIYNTELQKHVNITISIGVSYLQSNQSAEELISSADKALYSAKVTRNTVFILND